MNFMTGLISVLLVLALLLVCSTMAAATGASILTQTQKEGLALIDTLKLELENKMSNEFVVGTDPTTNSDDSTTTEYMNPDGTVAYTATVGLDGSRTIVYNSIDASGNHTILTVVENTETRTLISESVLVFVLDPESGEEIPQSYTTVDYTGENQQTVVTQDYTSARDNTLTTTVVDGVTTKKTISTTPGFAWVPDDLTCPNTEQNEIDA